MPAAVLASTSTLLNASGFAKKLTLRLMRDGIESERFTFPINPANYSIQDGPRAQVLETDSGGQAQTFGHMLANISLSGVTGWQQYPDPNGGTTDGFTMWQNLKGIVDAFITNTHQDTAHSWELRLYNWSDNQAWSVMPLPYQVSRTAALPMYYSYTLHFVCLSPLPSPKDSSGAIPGVAPDLVRQVVPAPTDTVALGPQLARIRQKLLLPAALAKDLIVLDNIGVLSSSEQALIASNPIYGSVPASQTLTNVNFPGIAQYTGYDLQPRPTGSVLQVIDSYIYPVTTGIGLAYSDSLQAIPAPYADVSQAQAGLQALQQNLQAAYSSNPPAWLMRQLDALRVALGPLVGQTSWFQS